MLTYSREQCHDFTFHIIHSEIFHSQCFQYDSAHVQRHQKACGSKVFFAIRLLILERGGIMSGTFLARHIFLFQIVQKRTTRHQHEQCLFLSRDIFSIFIHQSMSYSCIWLICISIQIYKCSFQHLDRKSVV